MTKNSKNRGNGTINHNCPAMTSPTPRNRGEAVDKAGTDDGPVSLAPLDLRTALAGLLAIPDPNATKPKHEKARRKGKADE